MCLYSTISFLEKKIISIPLQSMIKSILKYISNFHLATEK